MSHRLIFVRSVNMSRYFPESYYRGEVNFNPHFCSVLHGNVEVVRFLNTLPKTEHDLTSSSVDVIVDQVGGGDVLGNIEVSKARSCIHSASFAFQPERITLYVRGVFRETDNEEMIKVNIKAFVRTFVLVPSISMGYSIVEDMLTIVDATPRQISVRIAAISLRELWK